MAPSHSPFEDHMATNIVQPVALELNANRCSKIRNIHTGMEFTRIDGDPSWTYLYERALKLRDEFEVEYDAPEPKKVLGAYMYTEPELRRKNIKDLRAIAVEVGASGNSKDEIITSILENQVKMQR